GLGYFRQMQIYLGLAAIGIAVLAAFAIDALARWGAQSADAPAGVQPPAFRLLLLAGFWICVVLSLAPHRNVVVHIVMVSLAGAAAIGLKRIGRRDLFAPALVIVLTVEIGMVRLRPFQFFDRSVYARPPAV